MSPGHGGGERSEVEPTCAGELEWHADEAATRLTIAARRNGIEAASRHIAREIYTSSPPNVPPFSYGGIQKGTN